MENKFSINTLEKLCDWWILEIVLPNVHILLDNVWSKLGYHDNK